MAMPQKARASATPSKAVQAGAALAAGPAQPTVEMIAARAYELWQAAGCPQGRDAEHWYQAEAELRARTAK